MLHRAKAWDTALQHNRLKLSKLKKEHSIQHKKLIGIVVKSGAGVRDCTVA